MEDDFKAPQGSIRSTWNPARLTLRGPLTDRKIERYQRQGWYSAEFKKARRDRQAVQRREGNWLHTTDGRMVYSPR